MPDLLRVRSPIVLGRHRSCPVDYDGSSYAAIKKSQSSPNSVTGLMSIASSKKKDESWNKNLDSQNVLYGKSGLQETKDISRDEEDTTREKMMCTNNSPIALGRHRSCPVRSNGSSHISNKRKPWLSSKGCIFENPNMTCRTPIAFDTRHRSCPDQRDDSGCTTVKNESSPSGSAGLILVTSSEKKKRSCNKNQELLCGTSRSQDAKNTSRKEEDTTRENTAFAGSPIALGRHGSCPTHSQNINHISSMSQLPSKSAPCLNQNIALASPIAFSRHRSCPVRSNKSSHISRKSKLSSYKSVADLIFFGYSKKDDGLDGIPELHDVRHDKGEDDTMRDNMMPGEKRIGPPGEEVVATVGEDEGKAQATLADDIANRNNVSEPINNAKTQESLKLYTSISTLTESTNGCNYDDSSSDGSSSDESSSDESSSDESSSDESSSDNIIMPTKDSSKFTENSSILSNDIEGVQMQKKQESLKEVGVGCGDAVWFGNQGEGSELGSNTSADCKSLESIVNNSLNLENSGVPSTMDTLSADPSLEYSIIIVATLAKSLSNQIRDIQNYSTLVDGEKHVSTVQSDNAKQHTSEKQTPFHSKPCSAKTMESQIHDVRIFYDTLADDDLENFPMESSCSIDNSPCSLNFHTSLKIFRKYVTDKVRFRKKNRKSKKTDAPMNRMVFL